MHSRLPKVAAATGLVAVLFAGGCSSSGSGKQTGGTTEPKTTDLTVGIPQNSAASAFIQLAVAAKLTNKYGLNVELNSSIPPANTPAALVSNSIEASALTSAATKAQAKGIPVINALATATHAPFVLLAGPGITSIAGLSGKSVVTSADTDTPGTETNGILAAAGLTGKVKVIPVDTVPGRSALFVSKKADAVYEALNLALKDADKRPGSTIIADNSKQATTASDGLAFTTSYLKSHRSVAVDLVKACLEAVNMIKNDPAKASPYLEKIYGLSASQVQKFISYQKSSITIGGVPTTAEFANQAQQFNAQNKTTTWTADKIAKSWDLTIAADAAKALGYTGN